MDELIARVAAEAAITPELAGQAIAVIFAFIRKEASAERVSELFTAVPGAESAAERGATLGNGPMAGLAGLLGGGGGLMGLAAKLTSLGLGLGEMQAVGKALLATLEAKVGPERMREIASGIPGLSQLL